MNEDKVIQMLLKHSDELTKHGEDIEYLKENMVTKENHQEVMNALKQINNKTDEKTYINIIVCFV